jgi:hypothetical protein
MNKVEETGTQAKSKHKFNTNRIQSTEIRKIVEINKKRNKEI